MKNTKLEKEIFIYHAELCKVFSHPLRLEIINILREGEMNVSDLGLKLKVSVGNLSQHLNMMKQRGILKVRKEANQMIYSLSNKKMLKAFDIIREILIEQLKSYGMLAKSAEGV